MTVDCLEMAAQRDQGRGRGRPRVDPDDQSVSVHLRLPARDYDDLYRRASGARDGKVSVPEYIRRRLLEDDGDG